MEKRPATDSHNLIRAAGRKLLGLLCGPAFNGQGVAGGKHGSGFLASCERPALDRVQLLELLAKGVPWLFRVAAVNLADGALLAATAFSDFLLRHTCLEQVADKGFPVHVPRIAGFRYQHKWKLDIGIP